ncbi:winged helix-turn-helix domain-containing protein [Herbiconiux sp.]|uniref:winged helix-turn-helix transcriptional regulator n=1 Tax=Herbiconiux sp. TaxID=1871186 RepID=UPI0025BAE382|nr:winged helix-turn-helix domain-containing protein [Herbiconiux sp.]
MVVRGNSAVGELAYAHSGATRRAPAPTKWPLRVMVVSAEAPLIGTQKPGTLHGGLDIRPFSEGTAALLALSSEDPAVVVVSTDIVGVELTRFVEAVVGWCDVPVVVGLTEGMDASERAFAALGCGARSILHLPFTGDELSTTVKGLGFQAGHDEQPVTVGTITVEPLAYRATVSGTSVNLTPRELELLKYLMVNSPRVVPVDELADALAVYGDGSVSNARVLVTKVRKKLSVIDAAAGERVQTVHGLGYRVVDPSGEA